MSEYSVLHLQLACAMTLGVGLLANQVGIHFAKRFGLFSVPSARRRHERMVPLTGGLWIYLSFVSGLGLFCWLEPAWTQNNFTSLYRFGIGMSALLILGIFDDKKVMSVRSKFVVQTAICAMAMTIPELRQFSEAFRATFGLLIYPLMLIFIVGITNAINFIDGKDGLLATILMISFSTIALRGAASHNMGGFVPVFSLLLIPAIFSFTLFNWRPAKIFMGDTGSLTLGFALVVCCLASGSSLSSGAWNGTWNEALAGVLQLGYPILDLLWVISRRLTRGFSPFRADQNHLHHFLGRLGFSTPGTVLMLGLLHFCLQMASHQVLVQAQQAWPEFLLMAAFSFAFLTWIVTVDRWKSREFMGPANSTSPKVPARRLGAQDFALLIHTEPLFEGQSFDNVEQALVAVQSLGFMLESNCPKGTLVLWQQEFKRLHLVFPTGSVSAPDARGLQKRIQNRVDHWIEMFNISLSATTLRVTIGESTMPAIETHTLRLLKDSKSEDRVA